MTGHHREEPHAIEALVNRTTIAANEPLIRPYVRHTPVISVDAAEFGLEAAALTLKLEFLQHAGSFKTRGAFTNLLTRAVPTSGVVAASGGNHGAAVAYAAGRLKIPATIFVPTVASAAKVDRIRGYGAKLVITGDRYADALAASDDWVRESGALPVHAYDQPETLVGQGSVGLELERQEPGLDTLLVAVGGGGLIAGIAAWYNGGIRLIGVEPEAAPTLTRALEAGRPADAEAGGIAADSLAPRRVGELVYPLLEAYLDSAILVSDDAIEQAQRALWDVLRIAAEPGGAAALAALLSGRYRPEPGERVGIVICGANTTAVDFNVPKR
jgi:threonine dehydratase